MTDAEIEDHDLYPKPAFFIIDMIGVLTKTHPAGAGAVSLNKALKRLVFSTSVKVLGVSKSSSNVVLEVL